MGLINKNLIFKNMANKVKVQKYILTSTLLVMFILLGIVTIGLTSGGFKFLQEFGMSNVNENSDSDYNLSKLKTSENNNSHKISGNPESELNKIIGNDNKSAGKDTASTVSSANSANKVISADNELSTKENSSPNENDKSIDQQIFQVKIAPEISMAKINQTSEYFSQRIPYLVKTLSSSKIYYLEKLLDSKTNTKAYILASNENFAESLSGYFYYLLQEKPSNNLVAPFLLFLDKLFDEKNRQEVSLSRKYSETKYENILKQSLISSLGAFYTQEVYDFIIQKYQECFDGKLGGFEIGNPVYKLKTKNLEVTYHNGFTVYIEFVIL